MKIYGDLLAALHQEASNEKVVLTRVQLRINVPFSRLKNYISELKGLDLIHDETSLKLTEKGKDYLKDYKKVLEFMNRIGLTY